MLDYAIVAITFSQQYDNDLEHTISHCCNRFLWQVYPFSAEATSPVSVKAIERVDKKQPKAFLIPATKWRQKAPPMRDRNDDRVYQRAAVEFRELVLHSSRKRKSVKNRVR